MDVTFTNNNNVTFVRAAVNLANWANGQPRPATLEPEASVLAVAIANATVTYTTAPNPNVHGLATIVVRLNPPPPAVTVQMGPNSTFGVTPIPNGQNPNDWEVDFD